MTSIRKELHLVCEQCQAEFPLAWVLNKTNGAKEIGYKSFCSIGCEMKYFSQEFTGMETILSMKKNKKRQFKRLKVHVNPSRHWRKILSIIRAEGGSAISAHHD